MQDYGYAVRRELHVDFRNVSVTHRPHDTIHRVFGKTIGPAMRVDDEVRVKLAVHARVRNLVDFCGGVVQLGFLRRGVNG